MISEYIVEKYIRLCNFDRLSPKQNNKWNFRCTVCGDSKKDPNKRRGFILFDPMKFPVPVYKCYNCGYKTSFEHYLKLYKQHLYDGYKLETVGEDIFSEKRNTNIEQPKKKKVHDDILKQLTPIFETKEPLQYLKNRLLPKSFVKELYYTDNYIKFLKENGLYDEDNTGKFVPEYDKRIVIPVYNKEQKLTFLQGRAIYKTDLRYLTTSLNDSFKIWGLDRINPMDDVYCLEGVFDACFIPNSVAPLGASFDVDKLKEIVDVYVPDFDIYSNKEVRKNAYKWIQTGKKIFIPPSNLKGKDINDLVIQGYKFKEIMQLIKNNIYNSIMASVKIQHIGKI